MICFEVIINSTYFADKLFTVGDLEYSYMKSTTNPTELFNILLSDSPYNNQIIIEGKKGKKKLKDFLNYLEKKKCTGFKIELGDNNIEYLDLPGNRVTKIIISNIKNEAYVAEEWIKKLAFNGLLFQARMYDYDYDYWQNAEDPILYNAAEKTFDHLKLVSNGLPFPLTQDVIDISSNPGRSTLKIGYIENLGSTMWLGDNFIELFGLSRQELYSIEWIKCIEISQCIKIIAFDRPFVSDTGIEKDVQDKLRLLIYKNFT